MTEGQCENRFAPIWPNWLLVTVTVLLTMQWLFISRFGEPYPALVMPGFGGSGGYRDGKVEFSTYDVVITTPQASYVFTPREFLSDIPDSHHGAISRILRPPSEKVGTDKVETVSNSGSRLGRLRDEIFPGYAQRRLSQRTAEKNTELKIWLKQRAERLLPGQEISAAEIRWHSDKIRIENNKVEHDRQLQHAARYSFD